MFLGIDVSTYLEQQKLAHTIYKKDGKPVNPFPLFEKNGVTYLRTRIWNNPYDEDGNPYLAGTCDLNNFLELADLLKDYHFKHVIDFHYSDFWCDPSKQFLPKAWRNLSFDELCDAIYVFTRDSLKTIKVHGIDVEYVQTGNEITHGFLWPHGQIFYGDKLETSYQKFSTLLNFAYKGVKEIYPNAKIIIHLEESYNQDKYREIISHLLKNGTHIDIIGSSYYPFWHHGFDEYFANMDMVQKEFGLDVMNVELGFPFTTIDYKLDEEGKPKHLVINADNIEDFMKMMPFEPSPEGQKKFVEQFIKLAKKHGLKGIFYWEPLWIPGDNICWASKAGQKYQNDTSKDTRNEWANQCLFDYDGNMLPALEAFKKCI